MSGVFRNYVLVVKQLTPPSLPYVPKYSMIYFTITPIANIKTKTFVLNDLR